VLKVQNPVALTPARHFKLALNRNGERGSTCVGFPEVLNNDNWKDLAPGARIGYVLEDNKRNDLNILQSELPARFNPKYRIVISFQSSRQGLARVVR
jgi:hypothetical protein